MSARNRLRGSMPRSTTPQTLVWNGPLGAFEMTPFDHGTMVAAKHAASRTKAKKLISVAGAATRWRR